MNGAYAALWILSTFLQMSVFDPASGKRNVNLGLLCRVTFFCYIPSMNCYNGYQWRAEHA